MNSHHDASHAISDIAIDKARIALLLSRYSLCRIQPQDIDVLAGPDACGRLRIGWHFDHFAQHFVLTPDGEVQALGLETRRR